MPEHLAFAWRAFWDLSGDRAIGFGAVGPITFSAIDAYARRYGVEGVDEFDRLALLIKAMDGEYRQHMRDEVKGKAK